jgi:hypothetical protein
MSTVYIRSYLANNGVQNKYYLKQTKKRQNKL